MGYVIKHSTSNVNKSRRKGNVAIGVDSDGYSKTSVSGFYAGVPPVEGKHNFVRTSATGDPNFYCVDDTELINFVRSLGNGSTTVNNALTYLASRSDIIFTNNILDNTVTNNLILDLNATNLASYPGSGNTWYDLSGNGNDTNCSTFNHNGNFFYSVGSSPGVLTFSTPHSTTLNNTFSVTSGGWTIEELVRIDDTTYPESSAGTVVSDRAYGSTHTGFDWQHGSMQLSQLNVDMSNANVGGSNSRDAEVNLSIDSQFQTYGRWYLRSIYWDRDNDTCGVYYNGVFQDSGSISGVSGYPLYDGSGINWGQLYGWQHDGARAAMRVYNKVLSEAEVKQNYYGGDIVTNGLTLAIDASNLTSYESGSTISYSMAGSLSGSLLNGTGYSSEKGGTFVFDGSNDNLQVETGGVLGTFQDWSMDAWVKWSNNGYTSWMIVADQTQYSKLYKNIMVWLSSGSTVKTIAMYDGSWQYGTINIPPNTWTHIAATTEGQVAKMYVNGQFDVARTFGWNVTTTTTQYLGIGGHANNSGYRFNGNIALTRIYNRVLSDAEVLQNYNAQKARFI